MTTMQDDHLDQDPVVPKSASQSMSASSARMTSSLLTCVLLPVILGLKYLLWSRNSSVMPLNQSEASILVTWSLSDNHTVRNWSRGIWLSWYKGKVKNKFYFRQSWLDSQPKCATCSKIAFSKILFLKLIWNQIIQILLPFSTNVKVFLNASLIVVLILSETAR